LLKKLKKKVEEPKKSEEIKIVEEKTVVIADNNKIEEKEVKIVEENGKLDNEVDVDEVLTETVEFNKKKKKK